jgi:lauroyl/myristoyl acyltransferase
MGNNQSSHLNRRGQIVLIPDKRTGPAERHRWTALHALGLLLGFSMRAVPRSQRMRAARLLCRLLEPAIRRTSMCRQQLAMGVDTSREITLFMLLSFMTRAGCTFDPRFRHQGLEALDRALARGGGVFVACPHGLLLYAMFRYLHDRGCDAVGVAEDSHTILGTRVRSREIRTTPLLLRSIHRHLKDGELVCAMIDRDRATRRTLEVRMPSGSIIVSNAPFAMALQADSEIVFCSVRADRAYQIVIAWGAPRADEPPTADSLAADFGAFMQVSLPSSF